MLAGAAGVAVKLLWSSTTLPGCFLGMWPYGKVPLTEVTLRGFLNWRRSLNAAKPLPLPELLLEAVQELRAEGLVAAALAQELPLEGVDGVDVVARPGRVGEWLAAR